MSRREVLSGEVSIPASPVHVQANGSPGQCRQMEVLVNAGKWKSWSMQANASPVQLQANGSPDQMQANGSPDQMQANASPDQMQANGSPVQMQANASPDHVQAIQNWQ